ncbi:glycosyltransferase [Patescibacteria group bacterium]
MTPIDIVTYLIIAFGSINLIRMALFLVGSDVYSYKRHISQKRNSKKYLPRFSVVIPVYNEQNTIERCIRSVVGSNYPQSRLQVIVVDDGSTDNTSKILKKYLTENKPKNIVLVTQKNEGKANALNNGIKNYATGTLVMCLDSDSYLDQNALRNAARYFVDSKVMALSSNVKIHKRDGFLNLIQRYEYLICYQMKRAQTVFNIEYIIGGIGSTFRRSVLKRVGYYDIDTVTEDIDLTMKILQGGNKNNRVIYGSDVIAHTEAVLDMGGLIRQRYRWKWGRSQTFIKNRSMFFKSDNRFTRWFTHLYLPYAIVADLIFFVEPILVFYILFLLLYFGDAVTLLGAVAVISVYLSFSVLMEDTITKKEKLSYILLTPPMYFYFYVLSVAEYLALIKTILNINNLKSELKKEVCSWQHVKRPGAKALN